MKRKQFRNDLEKVFESGVLKMAGKTLTPFVVQELYSFSVASEPFNFTTVSQDVHDVLSAYGVRLKPVGIGWKVCKEDF